jgi:hypothetical protein
MWTGPILPSGAGSFASRCAHRLGYRSQRQSSYDRAINQAFKLRLIRLV